MADEATGVRPLRADAVRNRRRILDAAEEVFAEEGINVPIDAVAERAGVGVGTLYRHFPTKESLFEAIVLSRIDGLIECCDAAPTDDPGAEFFAFLSKMADQASLKHDLFDALGAAGIDFKSRCADKVGALEDGIERLRQRAVASGGVRDDVTTVQIIGLIIGACRVPVTPGASGTTAPSSPQMLGVIFDGLRVRR